MSSSQVSLQGGGDSEEVAEVGSVLGHDSQAHVLALGRAKTTQWFRNLVYAHGRPVSFFVNCLFNCSMFVSCQSLQWKE